MAGPTRLQRRYRLPQTSPPRPRRRGKRAYLPNVHVVSVRELTDYHPDLAATIREARDAIVRAYGLHLDDCLDGMSPAAAR